MARKKGSKNKPKEKPVKIEAATKSDVLNPTKKTEFEPKPDMGKIKETPPAEKSCGNADCTHRGEAHHGGPKGWCNVLGCNCQELTSKEKS